jgi:phage-related protein
VAILGEAGVLLRPVDTGFEREAERKLRPDVRRLGRKAGRDFGDEFTRDAAGRLRDNRGRFVNEFGDAGDEAGNRFSRFFRRRFQDIDVKKDAHRIGSVFGHVLARSLRFGALGLAFSTLGAGAASAIPAVLGLVAALAPAAGIVAALPGAVAGAAAAIGVLKLALVGVKDALGAALAGDTEKFNEALKRLTPAAQQVAKEFRGIVPALRGVQRTAQQAFFLPLRGQLDALAANLKGPVVTGVRGVARELGRAATEVVKFGAAARTGARIEGIFADVQAALGALRPSIQPVLRGFLDLSAAGATFATTLAPGIGAAATRFGAFLSSAVASGRAMQWMENALGALRALGGVLADLGGIVRSVFQAMGSAGAGALGVLGQLLDTANQFLASAQGQQALVAVFTALHTVGQALGPVLRALVTGIGALAPVVANIATALGPVLTTAIQALAPALAGVGAGLVPVIEALGQAVASLAPHLPALGQALGGLLSAAAPLIPILGALAAGFAAVINAIPPGVLAGVVGGLIGFAAAIRLVGYAVGAALISTGVGAIIVGIVALAAALALAYSRSETFRNAVNAVGQAIAGVVMPAFRAVSSFITGVLVPAFQRLIEFVGPLLAAALQAAGGFITDVLVPAFQAVIGYITGTVIPAFQRFGAFLATTFGPTFAALGDFINQRVIPAVQGLIARFQQVMPTFIAVRDAVFGVIGYLVNLVGTIVSLVAPVVGRLIGAFLSFELALAGKVIGTIFRAIGTFISLALTIVGKVLPVIIRFAGPVLTALFAAVGKVIGIIAGMIRIVASIVGVVARVAAAIARMAAEGIAAWARLAAGVARAVAGAISAAASFARAIGQKLGAVVSTVRGIPGRIVSALGNLGSLLFNAGAQVIQGLINGVTAKLGALRAKMGEVAGAIKGFLPFSPAKRGPLSGSGAPYRSGRAIVRDLARGLGDGSSAAERAMAGMLAGFEAGPFGTRATGARSGFDASALGRVVAAEVTRQVAGMQWRVDGEVLARIVDRRTGASAAGLGRIGIPGVTR